MLVPAGTIGPSLEEPHMEFPSDGAHNARHNVSMSRIEPRLLTLHQAAEYLSLPLAEVRRLGLGRVPLGTRLRYDRKAIDAELDRLAGLDSIASTYPNDSEDALARFNQSLCDAPGRS